MAYLPATTNYNGYLGGELVSWPNSGVTGKIHAFQLLQGIEGSGGIIVANPDFTQATPGATSLTDTAGNTWTTEGTSEISDRKYRFHGEMSAWPQSWGPTGQEILIGVTASGFLRRYSQQQIPEQSAMYRGYTLDAFVPSPVAYWPMEDGANSLWIASGIGGSSMQFTGSPELSSNTDFYCSSGIPVLNGSVFTGDVPVAAQGTPSAVILQFIVSVPSGGDSAEGTIASLYFTDSTVNYITVGLNTSGDLTFQGYNAAGSFLFATGALSSYAMNGTPALIGMVLEQDGADINFQLQVSKLVGINGVEAAGAGQTGGSFAGTLGPGTRVQFNAGGALTETAVGHAAVLNSGNGQFYFSGILNAWLNEYAAARFQRLCMEEGIQCRIVGDVQQTAQMGPQTAETLTELLQECVDADFGVWMEPRQCLGWGYVCQSVLGNQQPAVELDYNQEHLDGTLNPTEDDQTTVNDITVEQEFGPVIETSASTSISGESTGSSYRAQLLTGPMSVQSPPNGVGRYQNEVEVNLSFPQALGNLATQMLRAGSTSEPRYPGITVNLATDFLQELFYDVLDVDVAHRLTVANAPYWLPPSLIDQLIQGMQETLWLKQLEITYNGWPMDPWNCVVFNDDTYGFFDTDGSELSAAVGGQLASNPYFSVNNSVTAVYGSVEDWTAYEGTIAPSQAVPGGPFDWSCLFTSNGTAGGAVEGSPASFAVTVGDYYCASAWVYSPAGGQIEIGFDWQTSGHGYLSTNTASFTVPAGVWTPIGSGGLEAPTSAAYAYARCGVGSGATNGELLYVQGLSAWLGQVTVETTSAEYPVWTQNTADFPFDIILGGEVMTVISVAEASSPQTFNVVRGANGIVVAQAAGNAVNVYPNPYFGL